MSRQIDSNRDLKERVRDFWEESAGGEVYATSVSLQRGLDAQAETRYALEPYIKDFARFGEAAGRDVLEIGVGMGADHAEWAKNGPRSLTGIDLTSRAVSLTRMRLRFDGLRSRLLVADAEGLP